MMMAINIEKLSASNYDSWSVDMKFLLMERGVWSIVNGTEVAPVKKAGVLTESDEILFREELKDFRSRSNTALSLIYLNIDHEYRNNFEQYDDPVLIWNKLKEHYQPNTRSRHMKLYYQFCDCRIKIDEPVGLFSARLAHIYNQIREIDPNFDKDFVSYRLLSHLPQQFDSVVRDILKWDESKFNLKEITEKLVAEEYAINYLRKKYKSTSEFYAHSTTVKHVKDHRFLDCGQSSHQSKRQPQKQRSKKTVF